MGSMSQPKAKTGRMDTKTRPLYMLLTRDPPQNPKGSEDRASPLSPGQDSQEGLEAPELQRKRERLAGLSDESAFPRLCCVSPADLLSLCVSRCLSPSVSVCVRIIASNCMSSLSFCVSMCLCVTVWLWNVSLSFSLSLICLSHSL